MPKSNNANADATALARVPEAGETAPNFTLLPDEDGAVAQQNGVWVEKSMYGKKYHSQLIAH